MAKNSVKFSRHNTPLTAHILEVAQAVRDEADSPSDTKHSDSAHIQSQVHESSQHTAPREGTVSLQSVAHDDLEHVVDQPPSPNDYTSTDESQTSGEDEGVMNNYALTREFRRLKKENDAQAAQILKLKAKFKRLHRFVWPLVKHHRLWVKQQKKSGQQPKKVSKSKRKKLKKQSSFTLGRNLDNENLNEDAETHEDPNEEAHTMHFEDTPLCENIAHQDTVERKSDEIEQVNLEDETVTIDVKSGDTEEIDLECTDVQSIGVQGTVAQGTVSQGTVRQYFITPRTLDFDEEVGPSNPIQEEIREHTASDDETIANIILNISRPRVISIPGVEQPQVLQSSFQPTQELDPKDKGKGIMIESKKRKKKHTLAELRAIEEAKNEEAARKLQAELDAEEPIVQPKRPQTIAQQRNAMMSFLKGQGYKGLQKLRYPEMKSLYDVVRESIKRNVDSIIPYESEKGK
jgi:hypothetical protein